MWSETAWARFHDSRSSVAGYIERGYLGSGTPVPSNIPPLDDALCGGFRPGLHVIGGEPGAGKSALGLFIAAMGALSGARIEYISLEMSHEQCMSRVLSLMSLGTDKPFRWGDVHFLADRAREGLTQRLMDWRNMGEAGVSAYERLLDAGDPVATACRRLESKCMGLVVASGAGIGDISGIEGELAEARACGLDMAIVDYLQYVGVEGVAGEYDRVSTVSRRLNLLAVTLGLPVLALASCSRAGASKGPDMHAFKGSGDIEYHALSAMVIDRGPDCTEYERRLHVVKNRFGATTTPESCIRLRFDGAHNSFELE